MIPAAAAPAPSVQAMNGPPQDDDVISLDYGWKLVSAAKHANHGGCEAGFSQSTCRSA